MGYTQVRLRGDINKTYLLHRLVAQMFLPNPENKPQINHINGNKADNRLENLEWATRSQNMTHAYKMGLAKGHDKRGEQHPLSKPVTQLTLEGEFIANYGGANEAARQLGVHQASVSSCCNGKCKTAHGFKWQYKL
jgi:hypothetical protein